MHSVFQASVGRPRAVVSGERLDGHRWSRTRLEERVRIRIRSHQACRQRLAFRYEVQAVLFNVTGILQQRVISLDSGPPEMHPRTEAGQAPQGSGQDTQKQEGNDDDVQYTPVTVALTVP